MTTSSVPAVLAGLVGVFTGAVPVFVGEPPQKQPADFVSVGWAGPESAAVSNERALSGMALTQQREQYDVAVQLVAWQGDVNLFACVVRVYALLDRLVDALIADKTVGGVCEQATVTADSLAPDQTDDGAIATLSVTVNVQASRK